MSNLWKDTQAPEWLVQCHKNWMNAYQYKQMDQRTKIWVKPSLTATSKLSRGIEECNPP